MQIESSLNIWSPILFNITTKSTDRYSEVLIGNLLNLWWLPPTEMPLAYVEGHNTHLASLFMMESNNYYV